MPQKFSPLIIFVCLSVFASPAISQTNSMGKMQKPVFVSLKEGRLATDGGMSRGVAWGDFDNDGDPDLYVANSGGQWNAFYRNQGNGKFRKMTETARNSLAEVVIHGGQSQGVNWVDYDNDGDLDLYVVSRGDEANLLFRNDNGSGFSRIVTGALVEDNISASTACWADIEGDGDLDVVLVGYSTSPNMVFRNQGKGAFEQIEDSPLAKGTGEGRACACGDVNDDGLPEFYIANARRPNFFYKNLGDWNFEEITEGHLVTDIGYSYGVSWADYDGDGDLDLFVANFDKENFLYNNDGKGNLTPVTDGIIATEKGGASKGHSWGDYDNDGDLDLYIGNGTYKPEMVNFLYLNNGDGTFEQNTSGEVAIHADTSAGVAHADYDRDGDLDLFVANWGSNDQINRFYINQTTDQNWLTVRLQGESSNRSGIGARVDLLVSMDEEIKSMSRWVYPVTGYGSQDDYEVHFGLGKTLKVNSLMIKWPSGQVDKHTEFSVNQHLIAEEGGKLSVAN